MRTKADGLRARLARLERLAGKAPCPGCRLSRRHSWLDATKPRPEPKDPSLIVTVACEGCGTPHWWDLSGYPEELREVARLGHTSKLEDEFNDPRVWAARRWVVYWSLTRALRLRAERARRWRDAPRERPARGQGAYARRQEGRELARVSEPDVKLYNRLLAEAGALVERRRRRLERRYGKNPFPDIEVRVAAIIRGPDPDRLTTEEKLAYVRADFFQPPGEPELRAWLLCAEMEKIVLGDVSAYTVGRIEDGRRRDQGGSAKLRAWVEMAGGKWPQTEAAPGREESQSERERLEHEAAPAPPPDAPPAPPAVSRLRDFMHSGTIAASLRRTPPGGAGEQQQQQRPPTPPPAKVVRVPRPRHPWGPLRPRTP